MKRAFFLLLAFLSLAVISCAEDRDGVADRKGSKDKNPIVVIETSMGDVKVELDPIHSPITVKNFLAYVDDKFYDGTIFHRVIKDFMIQGGGFEPKLRNAKSIADIRDAEKKTRGRIKNEAPNNLHNVRGAIAMARTDELDSATAQFFIDVETKPHLDNRESPYCVFGKVIEGMDVVDKIRDVKTTTIRIDGRPVFPNVPEENVVIKSIRRIDK